MPNGIVSLALGVAMQVGSPGPSETPNYPAPANAYGQYGFEGSSEQKHPFDTQRNWVHGYFQELPAYGGHPVFRPYNYKHVLSQSQTAAGWGERPTMPYSQQFWHKYHDQATMIKTSQAVPPRATPTWMANQPAPPIQSYSGWSIPAGSSIAVPDTASHNFRVPQHSLSPNLGVPIEQTRGPIQSTTEIVNPATYQPAYGRSY